MRDLMMAVMGWIDEGRYRLKMLWQRWMRKPKRVAIGAVILVLAILAVALG